MLPCYCFTSYCTAFTCYPATASQACCCGETGAVERLVLGVRQAPENFSMRQLHTFASDVFMLGCTMCAPSCCSQLLFCHYSLSICIVLDMQQPPCTATVYESTNNVLNELLLIGLNRSVYRVIHTFLPRVLVVLSSGHCLSVHSKANF